jgi:hypothetical protein
MAAFYPFKLKLRHVGGHPRRNATQAGYCDIAAHGNEEHAPLLPALPALLFAKAFRRQKLHEPKIALDSRAA